MNSIAKKQRMNALMRKRAPSRAAIESALALLSPLSEGSYQQLRGKIDIARLLQSRKERA